MSKPTASYPFGTLHYRYLCSENINISVLRQCLITVLDCLFVCRNHGALGSHLTAFNFFFALSREAVNIALCRPCLGCKVELAGTGAVGN